MGRIWVVVDVDVDSAGAQVELLEKQVLSQSSLGGKMDALTVQVATQAMVGAKVEAAGLQLMKPWRSIWLSSGSI